MIVASRFRPIAWVAGVAAAALCCYLASQSVAAERAAVAKVDRQIVETQGDIRRLSMEIGARGRMGQIERWNSEVLALQAPAPAQFVGSEVQLASLAGGRPLQLDPAIVAAQGAVRNVAYAAPVATPPQPVPAIVAPPPDALLHAATFVRAKPDRLAEDYAAPVVKVSLTRAAPLALVDPAPEPKKAAVKPKPAIAKASVDKPLRTASLLPSDLGSLIAAEKSPRAKAKPAADR